MRSAGEMGSRAKPHKILITMVQVLFLGEMLTIPINRTVTKLSSCRAQASNVQVLYQVHGDPFSGCAQSPFQCLVLCSCCAHLAAESTSSPAPQPQQPCGSAGMGCSCSGGLLVAGGLQQHMAQRASSSAFEFKTFTHFFRKMWNVILV